METDSCIGAEGTALETAPLIHIGYPKAASTWTQSMFATDDSGYRFPLPGSTRGESARFVVKQFVSPHPLEFDAKASRKRLLEALSEDKIGVPTISLERLIGHWYTGGYDTKEIAKRIHSVFPDGKILIVVREQKAILSSVYRQYVYKGGLRSPEAFFSEKILGGGTRPPGYNRGPNFSLTYFDYAKIVEYYQRLFPPENVCVLPMEVLKSDPWKYIYAIGTFADVEHGSGFDPDLTPANVGIRAADARIRRFMNPFMNRDYINDYSPFHTWPTEKGCRAVLKLWNAVLPEFVEQSSLMTLDGVIERAVGDRFQEGNRRLNDLVDFDLVDLGYDL